MPMFNFYGMMVDPDNLPDDMPENIRKQIALDYAVFQRHQARGELARTELDEFWKDLTLTQMRVLRNLLNHIREHNPGDVAAAAAFYEGVARSALVFVHGVCGDCGHDHAEFEQSGLDPHTMEYTKPAEGEVKDWQDSKFSQIVSQFNTRSTVMLPSDEVEQRSIPDPRIGDPNHRIIEIKHPETKKIVSFQGVSRPEMELELMAEYRLDEEYDIEPPHEFKRLYCRDCGMTYVSLQDRMLRSPDECSGCFQKAKHG